MKLDYKLRLRKPMFNYVCSRFEMSNEPRIWNTNWDKNLVKLF